MLSPSPRETSHCKLAQGDKIGEYYVIRKLGKGRFATVYECQRDNVRCAIKVFRRGSSEICYWANEAKMLEKLYDESADAHTDGRKNLIDYQGLFAHVEITRDSSPVIHPCLVFDVYGDTVSSLLKKCRSDNGGGFPLSVVKKIMRDVLQGLAYIHKLGIIHTDIKPGNLLLNCAVDDATTDNIKVYIADFGSSTTPDDLFSRHVGTEEYTSPELILELAYDVPTDIWASFAMCYELITGDKMFDVYGYCGVKYGSDIECEFSEEPEEMSISGGDQSSSSSSGSDDPTVAYRHLLIIEKILGRAPKKFTKQGRKYYNSRGCLINNPNVTQCNISNLLEKNYEIVDDLMDIEKFLLCGLKYLPEERITAVEALGHPWLKN